MKSRLGTLVLILACIGSAPSLAQDLAHKQAAPSIRELLLLRMDHQRISIRGHVVRQVEKDELYEFADATGSILLKVDHKHWPYRVSVDPQKTVEAWGEFDYEDSGYSKLKVFDLHAVQ